MAEDAAIVLAAAGGSRSPRSRAPREGLGRRGCGSSLPALSARRRIPQPRSCRFRVIDALQKLCHDAACVSVGAEPRYFPRSVEAPAGNRPGRAGRLVARAQRRAARHAGIRGTRRSRR